MKKIIAMLMLVAMTAGTGIIHASARKGSVDSSAILKVVGKY